MLIYPNICVRKLMQRVMIMLYYNISKIINEQFVQHVFAQNP